VIVDQADNPGLEVARAFDVDEEGAFDVDVPELIRLGALIARSRLARHRSPAAAKLAKQLVNVLVAEVASLTPPHLSSDPLEFQ